VSGFGEENMSAYAEDKAEERMLAERIAAGDRWALEECYAAYGGLVRRYLVALVGPDDADDVLQDTFANVWLTASRLDPTRSLRVWLFTIARRRAIDHLRRRSKEGLQPGVQRAPVEDLDLAERVGRAVQIRRALARLPESQRQVIELAYFQDLTQIEIAKRLDLPLGTVKTRMFRGLRELGRQLRAEGWP
jgi:RNA polymerase sigma factor (sigma-70 family)